MRLANADILPVDFSSFYKTVNDYATEIKEQLGKMRTETEDESKMLKEKLFGLASDPTETYGPPPAKDVVPYLDWSKLENALVQLKTASEEFEKLYPSAIQLSADKQTDLNTILYKAERSLLQEKGLPRREWYRHQVYAPGFYTGYGVKTLPGIREAIEQRFWKEAQDNIEIMAHVLDDYTGQVKQAIDILK